LNPENTSQQSVGRFRYAGGLELQAIGAARFGGLSDLAVHHDGRLTTVTDEGQLVEGRVVLDEKGRLSSLVDVSMRPLAGSDGRPLLDKADADAEGIARLPNGDWLVSFERKHRIWRYPAAGSIPMSAPSPASAGFPLNGGLEGLTEAPFSAPDAYLAGSEGGTVWACRLSTACRETSLGVHVPDGYGLTALAASPKGDVIGLVGRLFSPGRGVRIVVRLVPGRAIDARDVQRLDELVLDEPLTRDNVEGLAFVGGVGRTLRLYLLTDNNYSEAQHTYLLAFDWMPR
jgi:hypothetical protein